MNSYDIAEIKQLLKSILEELQRLNRSARW